MKLLIVESPAKCSKIQGFLGSEWRVQATMGHIRALKEDLESIGFNKDAETQEWRPVYENIKTKAAAIASLRKAAASAEVYLGSDDDREGEAIAWHTCALLGLNPNTTPRVIFHEITKEALQAAVAAPGRIDLNKFHAQQSRTMLDMLIGFTLSPCLWRGVGYTPGLSAGRCQTPALRIIYDRDMAIEGHQSQLSWRLGATTDSLTWKGGDYPSEEAVTAALTTVIPTKTITITERKESVSTHQPPKPFITSSLQQEASSRLGMNPKITMKVAQTLYEKGHITYMRTDNPILSQEAREAAAAVVRARWGEAYLGSDEPVTKAKTKTKAKNQSQTQKTSEQKPEPQAAHEAIRPTHMDVTDVDETEQRLYTLIWKRTIQSVMAAQTEDVVRLTGRPTDAPSPVITTEWSQTRFAGWCVDQQSDEEKAKEAQLFEARKQLQPNQQLPWQSWSATEVRSAPPSRYTEASLIRDLESRGIGRPSTYATLVETVLERGYVEKAKIEAQSVVVKGLELKAGAKTLKATTKKEKVGGEKDKLRTTPLGRTVIEWLLGQFGDMLEYDFTAAMESQLDEVAKGARPWSSVLQDTWARYADRYKTVMTGPKSNASANSADFGDGYKMVVSKKGPLFVLEKEGEKTRFASVPANLSIQTATRADAESAFTVVSGETLGDLDGSPVVRKSGKFGPYVTWGSINLSCKADDTFDELIPRLRAKVSADTVDHAVGPYKIKKGPYGLYMFKTGGARKPTFVSIPDATPWSTLTVEGAEQLYKHFAEAKKQKKTT